MWSLIGFGYCHEMHLLTSFVTRDRCRTVVNVLGDAYGCGIVAHLCRSQLDRASFEPTLAKDVRQGVAIVCIDSLIHMFSLIQPFLSNVSNESKAMQHSWRTTCHIANGAVCSVSDVDLMLSEDVENTNDTTQRKELQVMCHVDESHLA